jgi:uncharacterized protein YndB with AHSA1/START domain
MKITVETVINASLEEVWTTWNTPEDIMQWNAASDDWHTTISRVDLRPGGRFYARMEARNGTVGFDFEGVYSSVIDKQLIEYAMSDGRTVSVRFADVDGGVKVTETFDADKEYSPEMQQQGWQSILDKFKTYIEGKP